MTPPRGSLALAASLVVVVVAAVLAVDHRREGATAATAVTAGTTGAEDRERAHAVASVLYHFADEYPEAQEEEESEEIVRHVARARAASAAARAAGPSVAALAPRLDELARRMEAHDDGAALGRDLLELAAGVLRAGHVRTVPDAPPDLARGRQVYVARCAPCHGADGHAHTPAADVLVPHPISFHVSEAVNDLSPFRIYGFARFGLEGTGMPGLRGDVPDTDLWSVAFYVLTMRQKPCIDGAHRPATSLNVLATATDRELMIAHGDRHLACLRRAPL